eukprot:8995857-Pyramimonas_sp.AAC.1
MPPPSQGGEDAPPFDSEAEIEDEGPGGLCVADEPMVVDGRDLQRDSHPADKNQKLGLAQLEHRLDRQSNFSTAKPREKVPGKGQLLARTSQSLDTMEYFEDRRIVAGLTKDELTQKLPLTGRRKT